jgi:ATP phosphoribosyltransferase
MECKTLRLGIPKGSLENPTIDLFKKAGWKISIDTRSYFPVIDDPDISCMLIRPQEMAQYVGRNVLDVGITGYDWLVEVNHPDVISIAELSYSRSTNRNVRWVIAVPEDSPIKTIENLAGKVISTEAVNITKQFLAKHGISATVEFSWGATEVKPPHLADAIVELTETGSSLKANKLRIIDTILESSTRVIINKKVRENQTKMAKLNNIITMLEAVLYSRNLVGIMLNVEEQNKDKVISLLPSMKAPTVSKLSMNENWYAVITIIQESIVRELIPVLKKAGAEDIVEFPLNKVVK